MGLFFGTDGLRGEVANGLDFDIAFRCGNSLARLKNQSNIVLGYDTRLSGSYLASAFSAGVASAGGNVTIVGVCPTAGVAYLAQSLGYDFGVVISASHNPAEFNGIKIFDKNGKKLSESQEIQIEKSMLKIKHVGFSEIGKVDYNSNLLELYKNFLATHSENLRGLKIVLDLANGASYSIAPEVFERAGAEVVVYANKPDGININVNCGSLNIENLQNNVLNNNANMGFAFDGDSDRVIAVDEKGNVHDGDHLIYMLSCFYREWGKLKGKAVVGTVHTNSGIEFALKVKGIDLIRTNVGDKYVSEKLDEQNLLLGGEQSGHIFLKDKLSTGDGVLNALIIASICKQQNKNLSDYFDFVPYSQINVNVKTTKKETIVGSEKLKEIIFIATQKLSNNGRVLVRPSGTEPYIRVMVESKDELVCKQVSDFIVQSIKDLEKEFD